MPTISVLKYSNVKKEIDCQHHKYLLVVSYRCPSVIVLARSTVPVCAFSVSAFPHSPPKEIKWPLSIHACVRATVHAGTCAVSVPHAFPACSQVSPQISSSSNTAGLLACPHCITYARAYRTNERTGKDKHWGEINKRSDERKRRKKPSLIFCQVPRIILVQRKKEIMSSITRTVPVRANILSMQVDRWGRHYVRKSHFVP